MKAELDLYKKYRWEACLEKITEEKKVNESSDLLKLEVKACLKLLRNI